MGASHLPSIEGLRRLDASDCRALTSRFEACGFVPGVLAEAERIASGHLDAVRVPLVLWRLRHRQDPAALLARLFVYGDAVPARSARAALGDEPCAALLGCGVLSRGAEGEGSLRSPFLLVPVRGLWLLGDDPDRGGEAVMGPGPTTLEMADLLPEDLGGAVLDLGCGAGSLALAAARRGAPRVVATDINPRALEIAGFNARLNGLSLDLRCGDLDQPVRSERFDWVLAQPPYVVLPPGSSPATYLHGGPRGEEIALRVLGTLSRLLVPGGVALVLVDVPVRRGLKLHEHFRAALDDASLDLVLLASPGPHPDAQALGYAAIEAPDLGPAYARAVGRYGEHLASLDVIGFRHVMAVVRAPSHPERGEAVTTLLPVARLGGANGATLRSLFERIDLASRREDALLGARVRPSPRARWIVEREGPGETSPARHRVRFEPGILAVEQEVSEPVLLLAQCLEASASVEAALERYAGACGAAPAEVRGEVIRAVRDGLASGMLEPAGPEGPPGAPPAHGG